MMKQQVNPAANWVLQWGPTKGGTALRRTSWVLSLICMAGVGGAQHLAQAQTPDAPVDLAQAYEFTPPPPDGAIPVPSAGSMPPSATGAQSFDDQQFNQQQYVVFVDGGGDLLLDQVRMVEPTAFRTSHEGQTVIQAGRFNSPENANERLNQLSMQGFSASVAELPVAFPYYAQTPIQSSNVYAANGELPPIPTGATSQNPQGIVDPQGGASLPAVPSTPVVPSGSASELPAVPSTFADQGSVEFGQELTYSVPPNPSSYPVDTTPPGTAAAIPQGSARVNAPYYVVIPAPERDLPEISAQIIQLGTPADRVQQRLTPRGPHVAIGPFEDRGLAYQWERFYREAGISNSRVYYDP